MPKSRSSFAVEQEWNFKACPDDELRLCLHYELAREIGDWREKVSELRKTLKTGSDSKYICESHPEEDSTGMPGEGFDSTQAHLAPLIDWPQWPKKPWLLLDSKKRKMYAGRMVASKGWALFSDGWPLMKGANPDAFVTREETGKKVSFTVLRIDWSKSDSRLVSEFRDLLELRRIQIGGVVKERRGGTGCRDNLKWLSAFRLLKRMTWEEAVTLTQTVLGKSLYSEQTAWLRANRQAIEAISAFEASKNLESLIANFADG